MSSERKIVGRIIQLARYPVKGMAGDSVAEVRLGWQGADHDRTYAFCEIGSRSGLPWLSARRYPKLISYSATLLNEEKPPVVSSPDGTQYPFWSDELRDLLTAATHRPLTPVRLYRRAYDAHPLSLISTQSIRMISEEVGYDLGLERFRANVVVEAEGVRSFPEEKWVGTSLGFGEERDAPRIRVVRRDPRCAVINYDPITGAKDTMVLRKVVQLRRNQLGVYGNVERPGVLRVGDVVWIRK